MEMGLQKDPEIATAFHDWYKYIERGAKRIEKQLAMINTMNNDGIYNAVAKAQNKNIFKSSAFQLKVALHFFRNLRILPEQAEDI